MRKRIVSIVSLTLLVFSSLANAEATNGTLKIASGIAGGTYRSVYAANLAKLLRPHDIYHQKSEGSRENLALLDSGRADIAFVQGDAYAAWRTTNPEHAANLEVVGRLGDECVYFAIRRKGVVQDLEGLSREIEGRPARVAVGSEQGGMSGTWEYLLTVKPQLAAAEVLHVGDTLAINQLDVGKFDVVGWVTDPQNYDHIMLRAVLANDSLAFIQLADPSLATALDDGTEILEAKTVKLSKSWRAATVQTLCTSALVLMRADAAPELVKKVSDLISLKRYLIAPLPD